MAGKQCPNCLIWVSEEDRLSGQCPSCKSFFESQIPTASYVPRREPAPSAPVIRTGGSSTTAQARRRSSGAWTAWIIIPLTLFAMKACNMGMRSYHDRGSAPRYERTVPEYDFTIKDHRMIPPRDHDRINEILRRHRQAWPPTGEFSDDNSELDPLAPDEPPILFPNPTDEPLRDLLPADSPLRQPSSP